MSARLFVALEIGDEDRRLLVDWARRAVGGDRGMRVVPAENVHLTLAFLGHLPLDDLEPLSALVEGFEGWGAPALVSGGALWLSPRRPHVLTVGVGDTTGALDALHAAVWDALELLGFERERRRLRPHLTVARVRHGWTPPGAALPPTPALDLDVRGLALMRSWLGGGGPARYEAVARAPFSAEFGAES